MRAHTHGASLFPIPAARTLVACVYVTGARVLRLLWSAIQYCLQTVGIGVSSGANPLPNRKREPVAL